MKTAKKSAENSPPFELKGSALTLMVLHVLEADSQSLVGGLREKFGQTAGFFKNAPLVIELSAVAEAGEDLDFPLLVEALRGFDLVPVGVRGGSARHNEEAVGAGLGIFPPSKSASADQAEPAEEAPRQPEAPPVSLPGAKIVTQPVRAGQRIVAPDGDLIVMAPVNAGAEILAGGNIHVYGALRGRALAGGRGDTDARIFCMQFNPDLVAVAGEYLVNDELDREHIGKTVVIRLEGDRLKIETIGTFDPCG